MRKTYATLDQSLSLSAVVVPYDPRSRRYSHHWHYFEDCRCCTYSGWVLFPCLQFLQVSIVTLALHLLFSVSTLSSTLEARRYFLNVHCLKSFNSQDWPEFALLQTFSFMTWHFYHWVQLVGPVYLLNCQSMAKGRIVSFASLNGRCSFSEFRGALTWLQEVVWFAEFIKELSRPSSLGIWAECHLPVRG